MTCNIPGVKKLDSLTKFREMLQILLLLLVFHACLGG